MKDFHRSQKYRSTETEKKGRKLKTHRSEEACKCYTPLVKLHWHDCPVLRKPCPIHGNFPHQLAKEEKVEPEQNITISFHPSSKTERLLQPVKSFLAHCNPDTKINFQYYSPKDFTSKESVKHQFIQTSPEEVRRTLSNNIFVEKTKSFVADKTNKMKKLKQCFHSPCNSIVQKTRSQTSVRDKINDAFREGEKLKPQAFFNMAGDEPLKYEPDFESFSPDKFDLRNLKKLSEEKRDSDFITVTHQGKNNIINHKIFEIKHRKGLNDMSFVDFAKHRTRFVYSTFNSNPPGNESTDCSTPRNRKFSVFRRYKKDSEEGGSKDEKLSSSEKIETSSSGSLYMTPFVLMPKMEECVNDKEVDTVDKAVQAEVSPVKRQMTFKQTQTSLPMKTEESLQCENPRMKNVSLQTLPVIQEKYSQCTKEIFMHDFDPSEETLEERFIHNEKPSFKRTASNECFNKNIWPDVVKEKKESSKYTKTTEVQTTSGYRYKEVLITCWDRNLKHETSQTEPTEFRLVESHKTSEPKLQKQLIFCHKGTQTSFFTSSEFSGNSKSTTLDFSNATVVINSDRPEFFEHPHRMTRTWWGKSYSETDLCKKGKCGCTKTENVIPLFQSCMCKDSDLSPYMSSFKESFIQSTSTKIFETSGCPCDKNYDVHNTGLEFKQPGNELPKKEQTSTKEDLTAAISDLSELKRIIQEFFEKAEISSKKSLKDEATIKEPKVDCGTMTDTVVLERPKQKHDAEAQTTIHVLLNEEMDEKSKGQKVKFRRSVLLDDENQTKTFFICALCGREMNTSVSVSTNTEKPEKQSKIKGKTTVVDTEYSETITVKTIKKTQNAGTTKDPKMSPKPIVPLEGETSKTLKRGQSSPQPSNSQKSGIPVPVFSGVPFTKNDGRVTVTDCRNPESLTFEWEKQKITSSHSKPKSLCQKSPEISRCVCREVLGASSGSHKTLSSLDSPPVSRSKYKNQAKVDTYASAAKSEPQGGQRKNSENVSGKGERKAFRRPDEFIYPVIIEPLWPKDIMKTWQSIEKSDDFKWTTSNQKRSHDKDLESNDIPSGKKIKATFEEFPRECFQFGKPSLSNFVRKGQQKALKKSTGFIWIPTSASQIFSKKNLSHKIVKSEESIKMKHQRQGSGHLRRFNGESSNDIFSVKRCHLKRIPFTNCERTNHPECGCCKSLSYCKTDKDSISCPPSTNGNFAYRMETPGRGNQLTAEVLEEQIPKNSPIPLFVNSQKDNILEECSCFSDGTDTARTSESNFSDDAIPDVFEQTPCPHSQKAAFNSENNTLEESFYFDVDSSQKVFWIKKN